VFVLNLETGAQIGELVVEGEPISISVGPNTLVYVGVPNAIYEYDSNTFALRSTFSINGRPGPVSFTPDGKLGIATNNLLVGGQVSGKSAFLLDLVRRTSTDVPDSKWRRI
jgi:hypothetical protein